MKKFLMAEDEVFSRSKLLFDTFLVGYVLNVSRYRAVWKKGVHKHVNVLVCLCTGTGTKIKTQKFFSQNYR